MKTGDKVSVIGTNQIEQVVSIGSDWPYDGMIELSDGFYYMKEDIKPHTPRAAPVWKPMYRQAPPVMARPRYGR
tara:strand:- start:456 stop:677 length:222 start_codon:yes stop_codon:yes gene_type:complete